MDVTKSKKANAKNIPLGTIRATTSLDFYKKTGKSWSKITPQKELYKQISNVTNLFKANNNFATLLDTKNPRFLKGQLSQENIAQGARINILPNNQKLDKAYSLFAKNLQLHDQDSHDHWDVLYQNKGGTWSYLYTQEKRAQHATRKFKKVEQFAKIHGTLLKNVKSALKTSDHLAVPMYTLLTTYMRIGNEIYYNAHGHKGLTTLKKKDITIKGNNVIFNYLAKDGVPRHIEHKFPSIYITKLQKNLQQKKANDFAFTNCKSAHPLREIEFKKAFVNYCGKEFYPHIVRSHHATNEVKNFLKHKKKITKEEANKLFMKIAKHLGHKRFIKKEQKWEDNFSVTIRHYIQPELVNRVRSLIK